ncbi:MAG: 3-oxoacyl-ACP synthase, partial [Deltaproteobacteria bacterium]
DMILPNKDGMTAVIRQGLECAEISHDAIDYISAHATATKMGDIIESQAIREIFGDRPMVTGLKSYMGHTMAACGAIETVMTLYMMADGFVAPTLNLEQVDDRCAGIGHVTELRETDIRIAQIQNFAFGGVNTALIIQRPE